MELQQRYEEEPATPAETVRVTPQELAVAISELESKQEAVRLQDGDTISIGQAIHDLGLEVTPEQLLAEIEARRRTVAKEQAAKRAGRWRLSAILGTVILLGTVTVLDAVRNLSTPAPPLVRSLPVTVRPPNLRPLGTIPDGVVVHTDYRIIQALAAGKTAEQVLVDTRKEVLNRNGISDLDNLWSLVKKDGRVYVRAVTDEQDAMRVTNGYAGHVANHSYDKAAVPVEIPVESFRNATPNVFTERGPGGPSDVAIGVQLQDQVTSRGTRGK